MTAPVARPSARVVVLQDLRLAVVVAFLVLVGFGVSLEDPALFGLLDPDPEPFLSRPWALLEVFVETAPLAFRRVSPVLVLVLVAGSSLVTEAFNRRPEPLPLAVLVALYTVAVSRRPLVSATAAACYVAALLAVTEIEGEEVTDEWIYTTLLAVAGAVLVGYGNALGRARAQLAEQRSAELARAADERTRQAVEEEKRRIAREMHDILAHHLSVIVAQAATGSRLYGDRPRAAADTLAAVESVGREALSGLRRLVGLLRVDRDAPDRSPEPGLDGLDSLVQQVRRAGIPVELTVHGRSRALPPELELSAFRIVQEALTNSLRHGGRAPATVVVTYGEQALEIEVHDAGSPEPESPAVPAEASPDDGPGGGYGLVSMQQRVALLGGELAAGPDEARGFRVRARLPLAGDDR